MTMLISATLIDWQGFLINFVLMALLAAAVTLIPWLRAGRRITLSEAYSRGIRYFLRFVILLFAIWTSFIIVINAIVYFRGLN